MPRNNKTRGRTSNKKKGGKKKQSSATKEPAQEEKKEQQPTLEETLFQRNPRRWEVDDEAPHVFWHSQPVPKLTDEILETGPIEVKQVSDVRENPYLLPEAFEWVDIDLQDDTQVQELYELLSNHYVEDDDNMFRFNYSKDFLRWALLVPGYRQDLHLGVRVKRNRTLCGCITGIPAQVQVHDDVVEMVEINFLCVHKKLRTKRLAPVLIKEITRRVNRTDRWQAIYTAGIVIPKPIAKNRYWHRSLNPRKLIDIGFSTVPRRMTIPMLQRLHRVPEATSTVGLRPLEPRDCEETCTLLNNYLSKFKVFCHFGIEDFQHMFIPRDDVVYSYIVEDLETLEITDFISFYSLPSTVIGHKKYNEMRAAYSYYNVSTRTPWTQLMQDALVLAHAAKFDVFNALDVMENSTFLKELKFGIGDGHLQYYLYNWKCPDLEPGEMGVVLL